MVPHLYLSFEIKAYISTAVRIAYWHIVVSMSYIAENI
jgi:hypothetical protein